MQTLSARAFEGTVCEGLVPGDAKGLVRYETTTLSYVWSNINHVRKT